MKTFKAAALMAPLFLMLAACNDGLSSAQMNSNEGLMTAAQEEEAFNTLPSEEEKMAIMEESQAQHALEADLLEASGHARAGADHQREDDDARHAETAADISPPLGGLHGLRLHCCRIPPPVTPSATAIRFPRGEVPKRS